MGTEAGYQHFFDQNRVYWRLTERKWYSAAHVQAMYAASPGRFMYAEWVACDPLAQLQDMERRALQGQKELEQFMFFLAEAGVARARGN